MTDKIPNMIIPTGGDFDAQATFDVLRARLNPIEFLGYLKGSIFELNDKASGAVNGVIADDRTHIQRALWYQQMLADFEVCVGTDALFPKSPAQIYWTADGDQFVDDHELINCQLAGVVIAIHSNFEPFTSWAVRTVDADGDSEIYRCDVKSMAERYVIDLEAEEARQIEFKRQLWHEARKAKKAQRAARAKQRARQLQKIASKRKAAKPAAKKSARKR